jgi:hypothetical protein
VAKYQAIFISRKTAISLPALSANLHKSRTKRFGLRPKTPGQAGSVPKEKTNGQGNPCPFVFHLNTIPNYY